MLWYTVCNSVGIYKNLVDTIYKTEVDTGLINKLSRSVLLKVINSR